MTAQPAIIHVVGNRPQFIKLAVLHKAIEEHTNLKQIILHTGQHSSHLMSDIFFDELRIPAPDVSFRIKDAAGDEFIGRAAHEIFLWLSGRTKSDIVLVYGDTNSTLAAAFAARRNGNKLLHFEAGVRTRDNSMPEEINRIITDRLSQVHYACTTHNEDTLKSEGYGTAIPAEVIWSGDLMLDAFKAIPMAHKSHPGRSGYVACTIHRAGNILNKDCLKEIVDAINGIHQRMEVVIPLHPHTARRLREFRLTLNCTLIDPLGYRQMKRFIHDAALMVTDSGGACREAFFSGKRCVVVMESPFWPEIINANAAVNCAADCKQILNAFDEVNRLTPQFDLPIFGDGNASGKIAAHLNSMTSLR